MMTGIKNNGGRELNISLRAIQAHIEADDSDHVRVILMDVKPEDMRLLVEAYLTKQHGDETLGRTASKEISQQERPKPADQIKPGQRAGYDDSPVPESVTRKKRDRIKEALEWSKGKNL